MKKARLVFLLLPLLLLVNFSYNRIQAYGPEQTIVRAFESVKLGTDTALHQEAREQMRLILDHIDVPGFSEATFNFQKVSEQPLQLRHCSLLLTLEKAGVWKWEIGSVEGKAHCFREGDKK